MIDAATLLKFGLLFCALLSAGLALSMPGIGPFSLQVQIGLVRVRRLAALAALALSLVSFGWLVYQLSSGWDPEVAGIVVTSPAGVNLAVLAFGALLVLLGEKRAAPGALIMAASFGITGHGPTASWVGMVAAPVHVAAAAWWTGCLVCLLAEAQRSGTSQLVPVLRRFSDKAALGIAFLLLAAFGLTLTILDPSHLNLREPYTATLAMKALAIAFALGLATFNRYRLTPDLLRGEEKAIGVLKSTVMLELCLIIIAIILTSILTTALAPPDTAFLHDHPS
jgi:putative copper export protein